MNKDVNKDANEEVNKDANTDANKDANHDANEDVNKAANKFGNGAWGWGGVGWGRSERGGWDGLFGTSMGPMYLINRTKVLHLPSLYPDACFDPRRRLLMANIKMLGTFLFLFKQLRAFRQARS